MTKTVLGVFHDRMDVETAIDKFKNEGFKPENFSIVMKDTREAEGPSEDTGTTVSGAVTAAVAGALMGMGLTEEEAAYYEGRVREGAILLAVPTRENQLELVMTIFDDCNASDVKTLSQQTTSDTDMRITSKRTRDDKYTYAHMGAKGGKVGKGK